jgi:hypothetical protein
MKEKTVKVGIFELSVESGKLKIHLEEEEPNKTKSKEAPIKDKKKNIF